MQTNTIVPNLKRSREEEDTIGGVGPTDAKKARQLENDEEEVGNIGSNWGPAVGIGGMAVPFFVPISITPPSSPAAAAALVQSFALDFKDRCRVLSGLRTPPAMKLASYSSSQEEDEDIYCDDSCSDYDERGEEGEDVIFSDEEDEEEEIYCDDYNEYDKCEEEEEDEIMEYYCRPEDCENAAAVTRVRPDWSPLPFRNDYCLQSPIYSPDAYLESSSVKSSDSSSSYSLQSPNYDYSQTTPCSSPSYSPPTPLNIITSSYSSPVVYLATSPSYSPPSPIAMQGCTTSSNKIVVDLTKNE